MSSFNHRGPRPFFRPPDELPVILCGPILRKVTHRSVSVFLALKSPCRVQLNIQHGADVLKTPLHESEFQDTLPVGRHLHLIVVTLTLPADADPLQPKTVYGYDLVFDDTTDAPAIALSANPGNVLLEPRGVMTGGALTYGTDVLPSFVLPAKLAEDLRIVHGSCRKPHGEGRDMLVLLDDLLVERGVTAETRPQLLLLTGDQIYADDVAPGLLRCLNDSLPILLGWRETVPSPFLLLPPGIPSPPIPSWMEADHLQSDGTWLVKGILDFGLHPVTGDPYINPPLSLKDVIDQRRASRIAPTMRGQEVMANGGLSSEMNEAHLIFLGEFLLMYLFSWSDTLWPRTDLNDGPPTYRLPDPAEAVVNLSLFGKFDQTVLNTQRDQLREFAGGLNKVRRALANVPTMMIFDDHEVTDDWNLNFDWVERVNTSPMGPRILRNALVAYALCQDWGSQPEHYDADKKGAEILKAVRYSGSTSTAAEWKDSKPPPEPENAPKLCGSDPEGLYALLGLGPHRHQPPGKTWNYVIAPYEWPDSDYQILMLDTRTRRGFPDQTVVDRATSRLKALMGDGQPSAGLVLGAALLSDEAFETQLSTPMNDDLINFVVSPAPLFGVPPMEDGIQRLAVALNGPEYADNESWSGNEAAFQKFIGVLQEKTTKKGAIILSGDVHYAFSYGIEFKPFAADAPFGAVQLCASAAKNQALLTRALSAGDPRGKTHFVPVTRDRFLEIATIIQAKIEEKLKQMHLQDGVSPEDVKWFLVDFGWKGWFSPTPAAWDPLQVALRHRNLNPFTLPDVFLLPLEMVFGAGLVHGAYDWLDQAVLKINPEFRVTELGDLRAAAGRRDALTKLNDTLPTVPTEIMEFASDQARAIVSYNNLGEITFTRSGSHPEVVHQLYWPVHDKAQRPYPAYMATRHTAALVG